MTPDEQLYANIILPPGLCWYDELGGQRTGWVCDEFGGGWWHVEELGLLPQRDGDGASKQDRQ